jgi:hypothetical protein
MRRTSCGRCSDCGRRRCSADCPRVRCIRAGAPGAPLRQPSMPRISSWSLAQPWPSAGAPDPPAPAAPRFRRRRQALTTLRRIFCDRRSRSGCAAPGSHRLVFAFVAPEAASRRRHTTNRRLSSLQTARFHSSACDRRAGVIAAARDSRILVYKWPDLTVPVHSPLPQSAAGAAASGRSPHIRRRHRVQKRLSARNF